MSRTSRITFVTAAATLSALAGALAIAQPSKESKGAQPGAKPAAQQIGQQAGQPAELPQLPEGWTMEDMQACMIAGTPGPMHELLAQKVGTWHARTKMWMAPGTEPMESDGVTVISSFMDGRYNKIEMDGEIPGMGAFKGFGLVGYDNVAEQFQGTWVDNHSTGIMTGIGRLSSDRKTLTWDYTYHCPINKKPCTLREVERVTGKDTMTLEMYATDPKSGKEYKMMEIAYTRKPAAAAGSAR